MKPSEVSRLLKIAPTTVRAWSNEYADFLSAGGAGGGGRFRDFDDQDLRVLYFVGEQKRSGIPSDEIHEALRQMQTRDFDGLPYVPERPNMAEVPMVPAAAARTAIDAGQQALLREIGFLKDALEQERKAHEADRQTVIDLTRQLSRAETLLELYKSGELKPPTG